MSTSKPRTGSSPRFTDPMRHPQDSPLPVRTKRAFTLLLLTLVMPGSAQIVAGDRRFGRRILRVTLTVWALVLAALAAYLLKRSLVFSVLTNPWLSLVLIVVLAALAVGWAIVFLNTLRIIRPRLLAPGARPVVGAALALLLVLTSGSLGYAAYLLNVGRNAIGNIFATGPSLEPVDGRYNFLVMGGDAGADRVGRRPDSIIVVSVDAQTGQAVTISIPRNFQNAQFPANSPLHKVYPDGYNCGDNCIINFLYTTVTEKYKDLYPGKDDPGAQAMMDAASGTLGIKVQSYILVDMAGFSKIIDAMGGVTINAGGWVPISGANIAGTDQHEPPVGWIAPGKQTLDGYHALWYARSREYVTDYARSQRQQCIQQAMVKQMDPATLLTKFEAIANAGQKVIESDVSSAQLGSFVDLALKTKQHPVERLTLGPPDFDVNFSTYPDFDKIHAKVQALLHPAPAKAPAAPAAPGSSSAGSSSAGSQPAQAPAGGNQQPAAPAQPAAPQQPAQSGPPLTADYLQGLAKAGDTTTLVSLLANNGNCTPG
ncbi:LCP family protein [Paenarthrobacter sp. DKR-5]|uniref:LCP family protein n=1 Tax=Paenarthrobacter sp. DKR-5 TaxID=2835535 RepID=UPI001BDCFDE1|nr:LCP family protein [Paenarthrobacter sp. DKR-5]MBT1002409.1 LCP family protein [Paenarthrobacter sp. DKR-5]